MRRIVVIGGGAAGASAAARARRIDHSAEITLVESTGMITHAPCGIPYALYGLVPSYETLKTYSPERFASERRVNVLTNTTATAIDPDNRIVEVKSNGRIYKLGWDALVLAVGAKPIIPKMEGVDEVRPITLRHPEQVPGAQKRLAKAGRVAVVGGGYIGLEISEALIEMGKKIILFEMLDRILPASLDKDIAKTVEDYMISAGIDLHLRERVSALGLKDGRVMVITDAGEYEVDDVVMGIGVRPNVELAMTAGVKLGQTGAVATDEYMETNVTGIFAAGDLVEKHHLLLGRRVYLPLAPVANKEGQVAGANSISRGLLKMRGIVGTAVTKFRDLYIASTGLSAQEAESYGLDYESATINTRTKAGYYPGAAPASVKMVAEAGSGKFLGVQAVGNDPVVASYIDIAAAAIARGMTIEDLFFMDIGYMPATAPVWHPLIVAARVLSKGRF
jgi:NADPH-dependent 2,4-dienoyl-CoA reductase/sulfur reductase-like enzyme